MPSTYDTRSRSRPLGITVLCAVGVLKALVAVVEILGILGTGNPLALVSLFFLALVGFKLLVLWGLWTLQGWAHTWAVWLYSLSALANVLTLNVAGLVIDVLIVVYLKATMKHFR